MAKLPLSYMMIIPLLISFALPSLQLNSPPRFFSLHLHLPPRSSSSKTYPNNTTIHQPLTPYFFADQPLLYFDISSQALVPVGSAHGIYLADPAASDTQLRYLFCTVTLHKSEYVKEGASVISKEAPQGEGSLVFMGSLDSGAIAIIGGTGSFAFASGQAKVSTAAAASKSEQVSVYLDV